MTLGFIIRLHWVLVQALMLPQHFVSCHRVWDHDPMTIAPIGMDYESWYGSPAILCERANHRGVLLCSGPNC